jgi:hypothetical protein
MPKRAGNAPPSPARERGNFISEWFGHRVYPTVRDTQASRRDQSGQTCPFLSAATDAPRACIKAEASKGVCTISSPSNVRRQDWLACPYRALSPELLNLAVRHLYGIGKTSVLFITPANRLEDEDTRSAVHSRLAKGERIFVYFDRNLGGELSIPGTERSPEFSFDVTLFEIHLEREMPCVGRFAVLEIQTADFHGSYRTATRNLREGLRMHGSNFGATLQANQRWLGEGVEGPNISNVFKRTFYQMMFKFQLGKHSRCAGCVLAIPESVWDSWSKHLAAPLLQPKPDGTYNMYKPGSSRPAKVPAWIFVFEIDSSAPATPSPLVFTKIIATDAPSASYYALEEAPAAALENIASSAGLFGLMARRLRRLWPDLASTIEFDA